MHTITRSGRWTPGYSLDDAARIRRRLAQREVPEACPACGGALRATTGRDGAVTVWFVRCAGCQLSVVVRESGEPSPS